MSVYRNNKLFLKLADDYERGLRLSGQKVWRDAVFYDYVNKWIEASDNTISRSDSGDFYFRSDEEMTVFVLKHG